MALTSDSQTTTNGANVVEHESAGIISGEDLEDGEIFEDEIVETPLAETKPKAEGNVSAETILSNIRNSKPLLPTPKFTVGSDKSSKEKHADQNEKKRRKRQSRDGDDDVEDEKKRRKDNKDKKHHQEQNRKRELQVLEKLEASIANDEDLIFARGASPLRRDDDIDRWEGEDEEEDHRRHAPRSRGLGRRDHSVRGKRRLGRGGSGIARKRKRDDNVCIFYMHGKCHRGSDCPYSHDAYPPRKMELCKFYMMDCCAKKDKCLYMHNEFPCKYYHTGLKCFAGKNCKFSHGKLSETTRTILLKHLETAPKEILGEFPRMSRDSSMDIGHGRNNKKIPSLFDIKVPKPANLCSNSNSDGNHTPMPSPTHESKNSDREEHTSDKEERRARRTKEKVEKRKDKEKRRERRRELRKDREKEKEKNKERSKEHRKSSEEEKEKKVVQVIPEKPQEEKEVEMEKESEQEKPTDTNIEPVVAIEENVEAVPAHLPKKTKRVIS
uniref:C3H1-type domain-containing protein n=1 Tax=Clastoptera arizonana TaxID=38151 RepID=A0A1B6BZV3_9HEMI